MYVRWHTAHVTPTTALMAQVADRLDARTDALVTEMVAEILEAEPAFGADAALIADVRESCLANVRRYLVVARRADDPPPPEAPLEALDIARTLVRRGIEADIVYGGYRHGQQVLWRHIMAAADECGASAAELSAFLRQALDLLFTYVDQVVHQVIAAMAREREQVLGGALDRRAETIRLLLDGAPLDPAVASRRLGHDLSRDQTALVVWSERRDATVAALETAAHAVAGPGRVLTFAPGGPLLWAWIGSDAPVALQDARPADGIRVAVGRTRRGVEGFRASHDDAVAVQRLMAGNPEAEPVASYAELEVTTLAAQDPDRAQAFVAATLGALAADTPTAARLRETLRVFLDEADNAPRAARRLGTHRNTVLQRVGRATALLGRPPQDSRLAVSLALELARRLGPPSYVGEDAAQDDGPGGATVAP